MLMAVAGTMVEAGKGLIRIDLNHKKILNKIPSLNDIEGASPRDEQEFEIERVLTDDAGAP